MLLFSGEVTMVTIETLDFQRIVTVQTRSTTGKVTMVTMVTMICKLPCRCALRSDDTAVFLYFFLYFQKYRHHRHIVTNPVSIRVYEVTIEKAHRHYRH